MGYYDWILGMLSDKMTETSTFTFHIFSEVNSVNMSSLVVNTDSDPLPFMNHLLGGHYILLSTALMFLTPWLNKSSKNLVSIYHFKIEKTIHFSFFQFI